ncbi:D-amino acid dehydrogenase [Paraburkholderia sp. CNPSo 3281]|uniref:D-amino acid dehydrogenase n=1 Tax=Paraburkholderia sp. CNPSo 3281 TaxID=2940933 RepID=UPI0020B64161|nr:D-amino acid dehydrogenase [Paraburkholderia sp. CNPSo 3281]MCP3718592.1 D-amino acid dehydrogenase [Paraburkholderia sp. CNPSo 3281]
MKTIVLGAGVIGVATAYYLSERGCDVTVVEREPGVALGTSFGNAGVIAPGYVTPWAAPGMPAKLIKYLFKPTSPLIFRPTLDAAQWHWIARWLRECDLARFRVNKQRMQRIAYYSRECLHAFRATHAFEYGRSQGYLQLFRSDYDLELAQPALGVLRDAGIVYRELDAGDCARFTRELRSVCEARGVTFLFDTEVLALEAAGGKVNGVRVRAVPGRRTANNRRELRVQRREERRAPAQVLRPADLNEVADSEPHTLAADAVVVALGVESAALVAPLGVRVPLYPVKGYSATLPVVDEQKAPRAALMDESLKTAITRFGPYLRVAGTAELGDHRATLREQALQTLMKVLDDWFPHAATPSSAQFWVGRRPMVPDGAPLLGTSGVDGLWLNVGHGSTGWAMSMGSGRVLADLVTQRSPEIDLDGLTLARYRH